MKAKTKLSAKELPIFSSFHLLKAIWLHEVSCQFFPQHPSPSIFKNQWSILLLRQPNRDCDNHVIRESERFWYWTTFSLSQGLKYYIPRGNIFVGSYAKNPVSGEDMPIWVADYVLGGYGSGAIMAVPAHDSRDHEFAQVYNLPIRQVVSSPEKDTEIPFTGKLSIVRILCMQDLMYIRWYCFQS